MVGPLGAFHRRRPGLWSVNLGQLCWALYAAITAADILPASATCILRERAHARIVSDWPGGATLAGFGGCVFAFVAVAFLAATRFAFRPVPFAVALFEIVLVLAGAFDAAAFVVPGSATVPDAAGPVATALRVVDFLDRAVFAAVLSTVAFRAAVFLTPARRLEPVASLGLAASVAVLVASGSADMALRPRAFRPDVACLAWRVGWLVAALSLDPKASATTASASSNVS